MGTFGFPLETVIVFAVLAVAAIAVDLYAHRADKPVPLKSAALWSIFWIAVSLAFGILFATIITLILIPALYVILEDVKNLFRSKEKKQDTRVGAIQAE